MEEVVQLTLNDLLVERPFTDPDHISADFGIMRTMSMQAWQLARKAQTEAAVDFPLYQHFPCPNTWQKRTMLFDLSAMIHAKEPLTFVAFLGNKRSDVSSELESEIFEAGKKLCDALQYVPDIVCYVTILLADAHNYANLVVMKSTQTIDKWRANEIHQSVTSMLSPNYYHNVRIYNGTLSNRDVQSNRDAQHNSLYSMTFDLQRVKYFDYTPSGTWQGVRCLAPLSQVCVDQSTYI